MKMSDLQIGELVGTDVEFSRVSTDTRSIHTGDLFVALRGERFDAHSLVQDAEDKGACALVVDHEVSSNIPQLIVNDTTKAFGQIGNVFRKDFKGQVIAITGSSGKSSVKGMLESICSAAGGCIATTGNLNNHIGVPITLCRLVENAPYAVIEAGTSGKGEIAYLTSLIEPDVSLVINIGSAHLEGFGSEKAIAEEKSDIYVGDKPSSIAVVNFDDHYADVMKSKVERKRIISFSQNGSADVMLKHVEAKAMGMALRISVDYEIIEVNLKALGQHNIQNVLAAVSCASAVGISGQHIVNGLGAYKGVPGRMEVVTQKNNFPLINDAYNANPNSVKAAIDYLAQQQTSLLVLGDMAELGEASEMIHAEIGRYARENKVSHFYGVGQYTQAAVRAFGKNGKYFGNKQELLDDLYPLLDQETVVLVKGSRAAQMETVVKALSEYEVNS